MTSPTSPPLSGPAARSAGVLLHPTSLPSPFGIGDLGPAAYAWVDALARAEQRWWQILPLGPTGYGDSPYQSFSSFAGNPLLLSPERLASDGLLQPGDWAGVKFPDHEVDYGGVLTFKHQLLDKAWQRFCSGAADHLRGPYVEFQNREAAWLDVYSLFAAIKGEEQGGSSWQTWPAPLKRGEPDALKAARGRLVEAIDRVRFRQFLFFRQWFELKAYANRKGVFLIGDMPIFVAIDSADVWGHPELFLLDAERRPTVVAGVPPDYFSRTGQLWGNPLYDWGHLERTGYSWWIDRLQSSLACVDLVRLDHFRGFEAAWNVPAGAENAVTGEWVKGPGEKLFEAVRNKLGKLPLVAEDLGEITPQVRALRDQFGLPGMRILQFAWEGKPENLFLPHNYVNATMVYTGSHDNDTTWGWYQEQAEPIRKNLWRYLDKPRRDDGEVVWQIMRLALASAADFAILPLQDLLVLGPDARMNAPGRPAGNWKWRVTPQQPVEAALQRLRELTVQFNRHPSREKLFQN
jgi:4-alpha-glucanotransferase